MRAFLSLMAFVGGLTACTQSPSNSPTAFFEGRIPVTGEYIIH